ncbi:GyrI-like domain-containing protein [Chryseolinea sp. H1M3-3]|uniref:GyrI-like domain-containing protein n=1 Tax=Chryseolinea sp. H1M3-3 TaxID=3034144 RepID=UPI0023EB93E6|nr:GyrI-like domain-containing protein [Chryseolinea sp. H1M3-3]
MVPRIEILPVKKLIGKRMTMSLANNKTGELWRSFMTQRKEILNVIGIQLYSLQQFPDTTYFEHFNPDNLFEKWAAVEVSDFNFVPEGMETFILKSGLYAIFLHRGAASSGPKTFQYIHANWLPQSDYVLDNRPHFELLGEKYKNEDPSSEEEIWIPIKPK